MKPLKDTLFNEKWHGTTRSQRSEKDKMIHGKITKATKRGFVRQIFAAFEASL
jgi:hypothetical protein